MTLATSIVALALLQAAAPLEERQLLVTVVDEKGTAIPGLTRDDVVVMEKGVARVVSRFEPDARPLDLALVVDTSQPMGALFRLNVVDPVLQLLGRLPAGSQHTVWTTGDRPTQLAPLGDDVAASARALKRVVPSGGNTLLDALVEAARGLEGREGRRAVVLAVTGTGIGFSDRDRRSAVDDAAKTGAQFLAVQFDEAGDPEVQAAGGGQVTRLDYDYVLAELAKRSGGRHQRLLSALAVRKTLDELVPDLTGGYRLTYGGGPGSGKLAIEVARPGATARWSARPPAR
jgi:VWA domain-containing protein